MSVGPVAPAACARACVLVTRPQPQADEWVQRLLALGQPAQALPLLAIEPVPPDDPALAQAWADLPGLRMVMFVSPNAVASFMGGAPAGRCWPSQVLAAATGPGTVAALQRAGVPQRAIVAPAAGSAQFDAEALWSQCLAGLAWTGAQVLIVRATEGRDWLADTLGAAGAAVRKLAAYRRASPVWTPAQCEALRAAAARPQAWAWLYSSSEAAQALPQLLTAHGLAALHPALLALPALATHPRIAQTVGTLGHGRVLQVRPEPAEVAQALAPPAAG